MLEITLFDAVKRIDAAIDGEHNAVLSELKEIINCAETIKIKVVMTLVTSDKKEHGKRYWDCTFSWRNTRIGDRDSHYDSKVVTHTFEESTLCNVFGKDRIRAMTYFGVPFEFIISKTV